jgi:branched-chain amino acid aminotransferase
MASPHESTAPFGTVFTDHMALARYAHGVWEAPKLGPVEPLPLHPATHALHYGSACFEGLKAHRGTDGVVRIFRLDAHVRRLQQSATILALPVPPAPMLTEMIVDVVRAGLDDTPEAPGSLYLRPTLLGSEVNIGAAGHPSAEAILFVLASPVGAYFDGGMRPLSLAIETDQPRTTPQFGMVKSGANYAMALGPTMQARHDLGVDQVLFAPSGVVQETGASNFLLLDGKRVVTPELTPSFLHGVTRDSVLEIATDLGYRVEERTVTIDDVLEWAVQPDAEAALSGTAAVLASVGELIHAGDRIKVGTGEIGPHTLRIRQALTDVQTGQRRDTHGWLTPVTR